ncbi:MAG: HlyC/CorC family transporter [Methanomicrobium sp.]|nr:HlyC/CorC family transporter [Methanomicrobium sp.]MBQ4415049.1 HlyC/CorC family transporter [Methanomicrobium sp.]
MIDNLNIALFIICLGLSAFFSGSEIALVSINHAKTRALLESRKRGAKAIAKLKQNTDHLLITILVGNNIANIGAASIATAVALNIYGDIGVGIATGVVTILMLVFGEIGPKTYAAKNPEKVALFAAKFILVLSYILTPVFWIYDGIKRLFRIDAELAPAVTEEEIKQWIDVGEESGTIEEEEHEMLYRVFRFSDTVAREIMTPRGDVCMIEHTKNLQDAVAMFNETGFTRLPVYSEDTDNITGILNVKDIFSAIYEKNAGATIDDLVYEPYFVPETKKIDDLLNELQHRKMQIALVADEYGSFAGLITMEDILEELVGEIMDEFDEEEPEIRDISEGVYIINAAAPVTKINDALSLNLPAEESYKSMGGLIFNRLGHIPKTGEIITLDNGITMQVLRMRGRKIVEIQVTLPENFRRDDAGTQESSDEEF